MVGGPTGGLKEFGGEVDALYGGVAPGTPRAR